MIHLTGLAVTVKAKSRDVYSLKLSCRVVYDVCGGMCQCDVAVARTGKMYSASFHLQRELNTIS